MILLREKYLRAAYGLLHMTGGPTSHTSVTLGSFRSALMSWLELHAFIWPTRRVFVSNFSFWFLSFIMMLFHHWHLFWLYRKTIIFVAINPLSKLWLGFPGEYMIQSGHALSGRPINSSANIERLTRAPYRVCLREGWKEENNREKIIIYSNFLPRITSRLTPTIYIDKTPIPAAKQSTNHLPVVK